MFRPLALLCLLATSAVAADRPNILWLTSEDNGPQYGCYGDSYATTPNIDALAAKGTRFKRCWSNAPVCAPARTCLISGRWAPADGAEHMRSAVALPEGHQMYPQLLRSAGYYCSNNSKEDYNLDKPQKGKKDLVWDDSSGKAHWQNRPAGQPFFAVFNNTITHESQIRRRPHTLIHDPAQAPLPPFHPDTPEVRHDWAQYYDNITLMDTKLGQHLAELEKAGLAEDTIIMHYGDHGPGMPRFKRWPYNSGLQVGLIMHFPEKWKHLAPKGYSQGGVNEELVSFVDLTATLLSIAGVKPPDYFQGRAVCGEFAKPAPEFIHGFRGRMDERYDLVRSTTDGRYVYIRNYMPQLPYGQFLNYMFQQATTRVWKVKFDEGNLPELQTRFWKTKPAEELYDLESDPWETINLADSTAHAEIKNRLAQGQRQWLAQVRDLGFIPEGERLAQAGEKSPKDVFSTDEAYPIKAVLDAATLATDPAQATPKTLAKLLDHPNASVRYWGVQGYLIQGDKTIRTNAPKLEQLLGDSSPSVRIAAAEALISVAESPAVLERSTRALLKCADMETQPYFVAIEAVNVLDRWQSRLKPWQPQIQALPAQAPETVEKRLKEYIARLHDHLLSGDKVKDTEAN
ncbi:MAG: sulfatase-like hydrolase/transferase [Verrucomicrobiota bacterium]